MQEPDPQDPQETLKNRTDSPKYLVENALPEGSRFFNVSRGCREYHRDAMK